MVNINSVYQKVLAIANKEQRGYITPQEFNLFADHAQMSIFEQYFYDKNQFARRATENSTIELLEQKIQIFESNPEFFSNGDDLPENTYQIDSVSIVLDSGKTIPMQRVSKRELQGISSSPLLSGSTLATNYHISNNTINFVLPTSLEDNTSVMVELVRKPLKPQWTYVIHNQSALYNSHDENLQDFELHSSEENNLVISILKLAGVAIKDVNLSQAATQEEVKNIQQEKA